MKIYFENTGTQSCQETLNFFEAKSIDYEIVPFSIYYQEEKLKEIVATEKAVFLGNTVLAQKLKTMGLSTIWNGDSFKVSSYASRLGIYYLNSNFTHIPISNRNIIDKLVNKSYFIRSDDGDKGFPGGVYNLKDISIILEDNPQVDFILSEPIYIRNEYRFVIYKGSPISGGIYKYLGKPLLENKTPPYDAYMFCQDMCKWLRDYPDFFVMDICDLDDTFGGDYRVVELNSFNSSGLYKLDREPIFKALEEYVNEYKR